MAARVGFSKCILQKRRKDAVSVDSFVNFYFHWLKPFGGWLVILILAGLPAIWLFNDSDLRLLPTRSWRLGTALTFLLFVPTLVLGVTVGLNPAVGVNPRTPGAQFGAALGLVMLVLIWVMVGSYVIIYWGMIGSESGWGVYEQGQPDPYLTKAQISALGDKLINESTLFPQRANANAILIDQVNQMRYPLLKGQTRMGRSRQNDIVLNQDRTVSRRHGMIWETSGWYVLHNYSSQNPIYYNGQPMTQGQTYILRGGDVLQLGRTQLTFSISTLK
jgi:hypothetical protein